MKVLIDSREQKPYSFEESEVVTLETGDYTCRDVDTAIERKSKSDFVASLTQRREQFQAACERASQFSKPMVILVEAPYEDFANGDYFSNAHPNAITGTIDSWADAYNIEFRFCESRDAAERVARYLLKSWSEESEYSFYE